MRVLLDHNEPFMLAHGGLQVQITRTKDALERAGLKVEYLRWWDHSQTGDVIHFFGRASPSHIDFAHGKGIKYVMQELLTSQGSRSTAHLRLQGVVNRVLRKVLPANYRLPLRWDSYRKADAIIANTNWEAWMMRRLFDAPVDRTYVIANAVDDVYFRSGARTSGSYLICVATITERKRVLELAQAAVKAQTPLKIAGRPYSQNDPYFHLFLEAVGSSCGLVEYLGAIDDPHELARHLQQARGFVLPSTMETQSFAALEAAASGLPLLLSDLAWARSTFGRNANYLPARTQHFASRLRHFYDLSGQLPTPPRPQQWKDLANKLERVYARLLASV